MNNVPLLPCPFCGHPAKMESRQPGGTGASGMEPHMRRAGCAVCNIWTGWTHPVSEWGKQEQHDDALREMLARQWNTRANLAELQREVEGLRAEVEKWRHAFMIERARLYCKQGMKVEQSLIHAETDTTVAAIDQARGI